ncbi:DUF2591 domain-containing protein [Burkholderia sp. AU42008]|uniref:phage protein NinX family protein n=1 Tax=unclassified Burkholderia TaxID=2613784 RepID=UPI000B79C036|nr:MULTISPECIES: phage protein NinX family protein [unclassified Burkholderia]MBR8234627.1 DUF2591 family protein [Burkholderia sp. AU32357]MBY4875930.1 DUF2591 domain-containing protein [Burkholderia sp. AU42008]OXI44920.1 hypothetical protein CFB49_07630 [Burkholderia sp. AU17457]
MKVSELRDDQLDFWVCRAELGEFAGRRLDAIVIAAVKAKIGGSLPYRPSRSWLIGGPIIQRQRISIIERGDHWFADMRGVSEVGDSPLEAAMRAYVASKFGDVVPNEEMPA